MVKREVLTSPPAETLPVSESKVCSFSVHAHWLSEGDLRLDASFHADEAVRARHLLEESGFQLKNLGNPDVSQEIYNLYRFKRIYTSNPDIGYPYLSASETFMFRLQSNRWIARDKAPSPAERYFAKAGWILVSCSGTLGRCVLVTKRMEPYFLTHDLIRIIPSLPAGFIYAFLSTWLGQALMLKEEYGGTISHLEPSHLEKIPVPLLPDDKQQAIHKKITKAYYLRDEANELLDRADELLHAELGLQRFDDSQVSYFGGVTKPKSFLLKASELDGRFDASFHFPIAKTAIEQLRTGKYLLKQLGDTDLTEHILIPPRFRRIYVSPEHGIPFLQGSHLPMMKPYDLKYLSRRAHPNLSPWIINKGWLLITCSGTIGRIALAPTAMDGWAASQHILRIIANLLNTHPGYLAAFLSTPYGQHQLTSKIYGGVVDELTENDAAEVWVPNAPLEVQQRIGTLVEQAFEKKEEANQIEKEVIDGLEKLITAGKFP
ncbi:MAG: restriction endonuclease subunit S [Desulfobaccales bacterium]|nr:restriction endonuclease subunit S [Desulfobaccales bacterium]